MFKEPHVVCMRQYAFLFDLTNCLYLCSRISETDNSYLSFLVWRSTPVEVNEAATWPEENCDMGFLDATEADDADDNDDDDADDDDDDDAEDDTEDAVDDEDDPDWDTR